LVTVSSREAGSKLAARQVGVSMWYVVVAWRARCVGLESVRLHTSFIGFDRTRSRVERIGFAWERGKVPQP
jgi:hypothetical protein